MELREINNMAVELGICSQEDADLFTKVGRSLRYRIDALVKERDDHKATEEQRERLRKAMWE